MTALWKKIIKYLLILAVLFLALSYLYTQPIFLENPKIESVRLKVDDLMKKSHLNNTLFFWDIYAYFNEDLPIWFPPRILHSAEISETEGTNVYGIYAEVYGWDPVSSSLGVIPYFEGVPDDDVVFELDVENLHTLVALPEFDEEGRPYILDENRTYYTLEEVSLFASEFDSPEEFIDFISTFEDDESLTQYVLDNYAIPKDFEVQSKENGPYEWETAFCSGDVVFVSFRNLDKLLGKTGSDDDDIRVLADSVFLVVSGCPTNYAQ